MLFLLYLFVFHQIGLRACDNRLNELQCGTAVARVIITRDRFPPVFVNQPYQASINKNHGVNTTVQFTSAVDSDLVVSK